MSDIHTALVDILARHVSPIIARSILNRALQEHGMTSAGLSREDVQALAPRLESAARLFIEPAQLDMLGHAMNALAGARLVRNPLILKVKTERDLADALAETRRLCQSWRVKSIVQQRIATVVSELARNMVSYTPGGVIELVPVEANPPKLLVRARDSGSGIPNLEEVLSGRYKSRTGLGKGLLGSKRLSDRFEIRTGRSGTVVEAELNL
jgi:serine/threonine-protein kinase RsbT